jgi:hypothetical protein
MISTYLRMMKNFGQAEEAVKEEVANYVLQKHGSDRYMYVKGF